MKQPPKIGTSLEESFVVKESQGITFDEQIMPQVLSTPSLIWFLEHAALHCVEGFLESGECTLGTHISVDHLAPTPIGQTVRCIARVIQIDGKLLTFQVEAFDQRERIARGIHKRQVVRMERFAQHVLKKQNES